jgi:hypothetical protein
MLCYLLVGCHNELTPQPNQRDQTAKQNRFRATNEVEPQIKDTVCSRTGVAFIESLLNDFAPDRIGPSHERTSPASDLTILLCCGRSLWCLAAAG